MPWHIVLITLSKLSTSPLGVKIASYAQQLNWHSHLSRVSIFWSSQSWEWRLDSASVLVFFSSSLSFSARAWQPWLSWLHSSWSFRAHIVLGSALYPHCQTLQNMFQSNTPRISNLATTDSHFSHYINLLSWFNKKEIFFQPYALCGQGNLSRHKLGSSFQMLPGWLGLLKNFSYCSLRYLVFNVAL